MAAPPKPFGRRNAPHLQPIVIPPVVYHAPQGLGGDRPPHDPRRLRSIAVALGVWGAATIAGMVLVEAIRNKDSQNADACNPNASGCHSSAHGGGGGAFGSGGASESRSGGGGHAFGSSGASESATFGGLGAIGENGAHGGGHGGRGE
jgi:hypothetical protein